MSTTVTQAIQQVHTRISDAIDKGYVVDMHDKPVDIYDTEDGFNHLGNVIQGNADSVNSAYYKHLEYLYRKVLGMSPVEFTKHMKIPTAIDLWSTSLRDPVFYGMYKNILTHWMRYESCINDIWLEIIYLIDVFSILPQV